MNNENPNVEWWQKSAQPCLKFTFIGKLTEKEAEIAIEKWRAAFQAKARQQIIIVWNCEAMTGYEKNARKKWTIALKEMKPQIAEIWLINASPIIRTGANVMGAFSGLNIKTAKAEDEIPGLHI